MRNRPVLASKHIHAHPSSRVSTLRTKNIHFATSSEPQVCGEAARRIAMLRLRWQQNGYGPLLLASSTLLTPGHAETGACRSCSLVAAVIAQAVVREPVCMNSSQRLSGVPDGELASGTGSANWTVRRLSYPRTAARQSEFVGSAGWSFVAI